jgi:hypothetical protein
MGVGTCRGEPSGPVDRDLVVTQGTDRRTTWILAFACSLAVVLAVLAITGPSRAGPQPSPAAEQAESGAASAGGGPTPPVTTRAPAVPHSGLAGTARAEAETAASASTYLAVAVLDRATGEVSVGARGTEPFYTASLSKVVLAVDVLDRRRLDGLAVSDADIGLIRRALGPSDDNAMNTLWVRFDGPGAAGRVSRRLGLTATTAPSDPSQWGQMRVPAADIVRIWRYILDESPDPDRDLLINAMSAAPVVAADGFDQAFGLLAPAMDGPDGPGTVAKQGWMCCLSGDSYLHSAGSIGPDQRFLVALLTRMPQSLGWDAARSELTTIATATVQALG